MCIRAIPLAQVGTDCIVDMGRLLRTGYQVWPLNLSINYREILEITLMIPSNIFINLMVVITS